MNAHLNHDWIAARIPHQGTMCLLDHVVSWNETEIVCCAKSHRFENNPLRHENALNIVNGIEYAAQAMAVHGALLAGSDHAPAAGFLASVRDVQWQRQRLDDLPHELLIRAERLAGNDVNILYQFAVCHAGQRLLSGRAVVQLDASGQTPFPSSESRP
ncbi:MAG: 3-hydroxylacyl-ACP dehydratase [Azonexus sp.]|jgi:predicted hotdog family 3-hydroxylacyl-ACP dehydratase|nr:3-hydroxylacyl-ACP dehydratase [Azonexus sp.]